MLILKPLRSNILKHICRVMTATLNASMRRTSDHASSDLIIPYQQDDMKMDKLEPRIIFPIKKLGLICLPIFTANALANDDDPQIYASSGT